MPADYENDLILVTCASGKQGTDLIPFLIGKWKHVRLQVSSDKSKERLQKQYPTAEIAVADLFDPHQSSKLLGGVTACWLNVPAFHKHGSIAANYMVDAAVAQREAGGPFQHIVFTSVIFPVIRKMSNHSTKALAEEYLIESFLPYTILQPSHFADNLPIAKLMSEEKPVYPAPYNPETVFTWTMTKDLGEAGARILEQREKHYFATYQCVSTSKPMKYTEVIDIVGREIGKTIEIQPQPLEKAVGMMAARMGNSPASREGLSRMLLYYSERGLVGNNNVLEMLLGHKTTTYEDWARAKVKEIREQGEQAK